jgi:dihydrofolate reductase
MISIIVAIAENYAIGKNNDLLWHIPEDMKRFKRITLGHKIIMGKRTYESLPYRPLKDRTNIVISDIPGDSYEGAVMAYSIEEALQHCHPDEECFVIGGGMVYRQFMEIADKLYITWVHKEFEADTFYPEISPEVWKEIEREEAKEGHPDFRYSFVTYRRRKQDRVRSKATTG